MKTYDEPKSIDFQECNTGLIKKNWFVVKTRPRHEKKLNVQLTALGYTTYLPLYSTVRIWSDRKKKVQLPLIPSTLFVRDPEADKKLLYGTAGFHSILRYNGEIGIVRPEEIEQLRIMCGEGYEGFEKAELESFAAGDEVEIIGGPFIGHYAKAIEEINKYRVLIAVPLLGIGYSVDIAKNNIRKLTVN